MAEVNHPALEGETVTAQYWRALTQGTLQYQRCRNCGESQLPPRRQCTNCLRDELVWEQAGGRGRILSWMVYHYAIRDEFKDRVPYNVAIVELSEGPRLITNIVGIDNDDLRIDLPVSLAIEYEDGLALARFRPDEAGDDGE